MNQPHIIHNPKNLDRHFSILEQLASQGIEEYVFEPAVFKENSTQAVREAHQNIIKRNYDKEFITIFEDDIIFTSPKSWEKYWEWFDELPDGWCVYLGGCYSFKEKVAVSDNLEQLRGKFSGLHWYTIHKRFYDKFLSEESHRHHIDKWIGHTGVPKYAPKLLPSRQAEVDFEKWAASERRSNEKRVRPANYRNWRIKHKYLT